MDKNQHVHQSKSKTSKGSNGDKNAIANKLGGALKKNIVEK